MDSYKQFYYDTVPFATRIDFGSIKERVALRKRLKCRPFSWFLRHVYPQLKIKGVRDLARGLVRQSDNCLDITGDNSNLYIYVYQ